MIIKKFTAKTEKDAVEAAKKDLGADLVVMNVKKLNRKGLFAVFKPQKVEVTVALEEERERVPAAVKEKKEESFNKELTGLERASINKDIIFETPQKEQDKVIEDKLDSLQTLLEKQLMKPAFEEKKEEQTETVEEVNQNVQFIKLLYNTMLENEVDEKYANQIIEDLDKNIPIKQNIDFILSNIYQKMILKFGNPNGITLSKSKPKIIFFVGPTGVGKTTTIAKLASKFCVEHKKKVALLTGDTYRIAAVEQLRTYANILEVPFRVIYTKDEMKSNIEEFKKYDYIMVDTAGHSHKNGAQQSDMMQLVSGIPDSVEKEIYLVVSATTKCRDLYRIADAYSDIGSYKIIFTKLDETTALGNILNLKLYTGAELSYITCGQNVPEDIADFHPQKLVKHLLGGN